MLDRFLKPDSFAMDAAVAGAVLLGFLAVMLFVQVSWRRVLVPMAGKVEGDANAWAPYVVACA